MPNLHAPVISGLTAAILLFLQIVLMLGVVLQRRSKRQSLGDGNNPQLLQAIRRHGNFAENAAIFVAALTLFELLGGNLQHVEILAAAFVLGRLSHAIGLSMKSSVNVFRLIGAVTTALVGMALAVQLAMLVLPLLPQ